MKYFISIIFFVFFLFPSCTRVITKSIQLTDSTAIKIWKDSVDFHKKINEELLSELSSSQLNKILFDTLFVPGDTVYNTITVKETGEIVAKGKIKSAYLSRDFAIKIAQQKQIQIDSLQKALTDEKKMVKVVEKEIYKKTKVFIGWWLLIIGFIFGIYIGVRYKDYFTKII